MLGQVARRPTFVLFIFVLTCIALVSAACAAGPTPTPTFEPTATPIFSPPPELRIVHSYTKEADIEAPSSEIVSMKVIFKNAWRISGFSFSVNYDPAVLQVVGITGLGREFHSFFSNEEGWLRANSVAIRNANRYDLPVFDIVFKVIGSPGQSSPLTFGGTLREDPLVFDEKSNELDFRTMPGTIRVPSNHP